MSEEFEVTVTVTRGTDPNDREKLKTTVAAGSMEELDERMAEMRERLEEWADDLRQVSPERRRRLTEDQSTLGEGEA